MGEERYDEWLNSNTIDAIVLYKHTKRDFTSKNQENLQNDPLTFSSSSSSSSSSLPSNPREKRCYLGSSFTPSLLNDASPYYIGAMSSDNSHRYLFFPSVFPLQISLTFTHTLFCLQSLSHALSHTDSLRYYLHTGSELILIVNVKRHYLLLLLSLSSAQLIDPMHSSSLPLPILTVSREVYVCVCVCVCVCVYEN